MTNRTLIAPYALLPTGWSADVRIDLDADGTIASITADSPHAGATLLRGPVIPGLPNVHSHAFQRAFAGRAERRTSEHDSFWTWRRAMYELAGRISPDDLEAIATQLYVEMLEAGYTAVGEFHYVHHDAGGRPFAIRSEMSQRLLAAAETAGIAITLLPVLYHWSGFGRAPALPEQARFVNDVDAFVALLDELAPLCRVPGRRLGIAPHSLRAVAPDELRAVVAALDERDSDAPIHLHVAEQTGEVQASLAALGTRPVRWLLDNVALSSRWCLVHATHLDSAESADAAASGAVAGLCPTTEANLGDGIFALAPWLAANGAIALGSDSHVSVDAAQEVRWLEYAQRLQARRRAIVPSPQAAYIAAACGGAQALGQLSGALAVGRRADFVVIDADHPTVAGDDVATIVDRYIVCGGPPAIAAVFVGGIPLVEAGRHQKRDEVAARFRATLKRLAPASRASFAN